MRGTIEKLPSGKFRISVFLGKDAEGKWIRTRRTVEGAKKDAERELTKMLRDLDTGGYVEPARLTVREYLGRWLRDYVSTHVEKESTRQGYGRRVNKHLIPGLGTIMLPKLTALRLQELYRVKLESGLSPTTVNDIHRTLHIALECAVRWGLVGRNVCDAAEPPKKRRLEMETWTPEECARFLAIARENRYFPLFAAAIYTGMRQGELLGLRWSDVDLDRGVLTIQQTLERSGPAPRFGTPKTAKSRRTVPLTSDLVAILRIWKARQNAERLLLGTEYRDLGLVFTILGGGAVSRHNLVRRDFARLTKAAELAPIRFHDLRHTFASFLMAANYELKIVSEMLGHSGIAITADTYGHLKLGPRVEAADVVGRMLAGASNQ